MLALAGEPAWTPGSGSRIHDPALRALLDTHWSQVVCDRAKVLGLPQEPCEAPPRDWMSRVRSLPVETLDPFERDVYDAFVWYAGGRVKSEEPPPPPDAFLGVRVGPTVLESHRADPADTIAALRARLHQGWRPLRAEVQCVLSTFDALPMVRGRYPSAISWVPVAQPGAGVACAPRPAGFDRWAMAPVAAGPVDRGLDGQLRRYRRFLEREVAPRAIEGRELGTRDAMGAYVRSLADALGGPVEPDVLHNRAEVELAEVHAEMLALARASGLEADDLPALLSLLRSGRWAFASGAAVWDAGQTNVRRSREALPQMVEVLPASPCDLRQARGDDIGSYWQPRSPGEPGHWAVHLDHPEETWTFFAQPLAFHECWPGHHYQFARHLEDESLPAFLRYSWNRGYSEGWAMYAERMADEAGLYTTPLDRMGLLSYDAWRLVRVLAETGVFSRGWSEAQVRTLYGEATPVPGWAIDLEVRRVIYNPGWLISHKAGQWAILDARRAAEQALGPRFDPIAFHEVVLGAGAVPLPVLRRRVDRWIEAQGAQTQ